ncbi:hypothetical protein LSH36_112g01031 [Paralvinella palmiformis]|uniref:Ribonuclease 3 n=1 Tax=Paralvinella palmiformis TaxID=53620 RepID=A0AAD9N939_9ANNE|nr:hypothetical protein LSH36_112g01031 [Paralvinella palmiformis]
MQQPGFRGRGPVPQQGIPHRLQPPTVPSGPPTPVPGIPPPAPPFNRAAPPPRGFPRGFPGPRGWPPIRGPGRPPFQGPIPPWGPAPPHADGPWNQPSYPAEGSFPPGVGPLYDPAQASAPSQNDTIHSNPHVDRGDHLSSYIDPDSKVYPDQNPHENYGYDYHTAFSDPNKEDVPKCSYEHKDVYASTSHHYREDYSWNQSSFEDKDLLRQTETLYSDYSTNEEYLKNINQEQVHRSSEWDYRRKAEYQEQSSDYSSRRHRRDTSEDPYDREGKDRELKTGYRHGRDRRETSLDDDRHRKDDRFGHHSRERVSQGRGSTASQRKRSSDLRYPDESRKHRRNEAGSEYSSRYDASRPRRETSSYREDDRLSSSGSKGHSANSECKHSSSVEQFVRNEEAQQSRSLPSSESESHSHHKGSLRRHMDSKDKPSGSTKKPREDPSSKDKPDLPAEDYIKLSDLATFDGIPYIEDDVNNAELDEMMKMSEEDVELPAPPAWTRCSPADLYFKRKPQSGELESSERMKELEKKFLKLLVQRANNVRKARPSVARPPRIPPSKIIHWHKEEVDKKPKLKDSSTSSSDEEEESLDKLHDNWVDELQRKREHPERIHSELWFNEPMEMNDGPLCHCSEKAKKSGIRHNIYPGEEIITKCDISNNNANKLYHYTITMSPPTNFLTKYPTVINYDNHEYIFEGFSLFSHYKIDKVPVCKVIRFNIEYTIHWIEDDMPENFTINSLDLFSKYLFTELLELYDLDWHSTDEQCGRFHFMPRFARKLPDNGKELLSMNEVLNYLLRVSRPLVDPADLKKYSMFTQREWQNFVDQVRGMLVTLPGKRPSTIRIDQLDRLIEQNDETSLTPTVQYPKIIHFGVRPAQLSYAGDPVYQKVWKEYMKLQHLVANKPKVTSKDKEDLKKKEDLLQDIRIKGSMKREVTVEISSQGYIRTGVCSDVSQHALLLPVLITHLRFHRCLDILEKKIKYKFKDRYLLQLALTHPSYRTNYGTNPDHSRNSLSNCGMRQLEYGDRRVHYVHTRKRGINTLIHIMAKLGRREETASEINHYERLEFLGDAVVEFLTSIHLFFMFPNLAEGGLAMYRAAIVQNQHLTVLARKLGLQHYMLYGHGPDLCQDYSLRHAMANCFEALMGALLIDSGIEVADRIFGETLFGDQLELYSVWTNLPPHPLQEDEPNGDRHWIGSSIPLQKMAKFEDATGIEFTHIRLLARAFTMRNVGFNHLTFGHNQRMEFLGDTVLQFISSEYLYKHFPEHHEGHLSLLRSSLVNNRTQAVVCDDLGMTNYIINTNHHLSERNELKMKEKADLVEAFLGALYIDKDLEFCATFCKVCFFPRLKQFIMNQDWNDPKSQLQQCCLTLRELHDEDPDIPTYKVLQSTGPTNTRKYTVAVYFRGKRMAVGEGHSIQQAEMDAASNALQNKQNLFPHLLYQKAFLARKFHRYTKKDRASKSSQLDGKDRQKHRHISSGKKKESQWIDY